MRFSLILIALFSTMFFACEKNQEIPMAKEPSYDTIYPRSYFPVYPGSWWKYKINNAEIITSSVSNEYQLNFYRISDNSSLAPLLYSDTVYVPLLDAQPIYGYEKIEWRRPPFGDYYIEWPILSETVGFKFERNWEDKRYGDFTEKVEVKQKLLHGTDSVLILEGHWVYGPNQKNKSYQTYIKEIGLVKEFIVDTTTSDTLYKKELIDYFVND